MNVVWLIQNLVPYHHARFEAFSKNEGVNAHLIQVTDKDDFSVLEFQPERQDYQLHTLFPGRDRSAISTLDIAEQLEKKLSGINPDCACVSGWGMVIGQRLQAWALARRIPVVMFSESTTHDEPRVFYKEWLKGVLVRNASAALVGGASHRDYIHQLGMPSESVFDGHNVVDGHYFSDPAGARPEELPAWLENEPYFAVCTRFGEKKNLPRLVRAYARYTEKCGSGNLDPARLVLGGDGETRREVEAEIKALNMQDKVTLLGSLGYRVLPWFYQHCSAFIHASTTEQWGLVVNEAMAAGAPLLLSHRCGCAPDLLSENENGFGFDPFDESSIADTLLRFTKLGTAKQVAFGACSRSRIQNWGAQRFADNLLKAVEHAMAVGPSRNSMPARLVLRVLDR